MNTYKKFIGRILRFGALSLVVALMAEVKVSALTFNFDQTLSGVAPAGPTPWLTASFTSAGANTVQLTLAASGLTGSEFVNQWYFNFNPDLNLGGLVFTQTGSSGSFNSPTVQTGVNAFKPGGDGKYDILFNFNPSVGQFGAGDSVTFDITGVAGLSTSDFLFYNTSAAGHAPLYSAAYIQTIGESVIIDTPPQTDRIPDGGTTVLLLGAAMTSIGLLRKKFLV
jgi:hypothetical protein